MGLFDSLINSHLYIQGRRHCFCQEADRTNFKTPHMHACRIESNLDDIEIESFQQTIYDDDATNYY